MVKGRDVVLGILNRSSKTGYEINDILKNQLSYFYDGTFGMIYPTLRKLEAEGKIKKEQIIQDGKPNKKVYSITVNGKKEFEEYMHSEVDSETFKSDFLLRLYFQNGVLSKGEVINLFDQEIKRKKEQLVMIQNNFKEWKKKGMQDLQKVTLEYGISYYENMIEFLTKKKNEFLNK